MKTRLRHMSAFAAALIPVLIIAAFAPALRAQSAAVESIRGADMKFHLDFLSAPEFRGRNAPSVEIDIATRYIAAVAAQIGLKPLLPGGSYLQEVPVEVTRVLPAGSRLRLLENGGERTFYFPQAFGAGRIPQAGTVSGPVVFLGYGLQAPDLGWDDYDGVNVAGKIAVILDPALPESHALKPAANRRALLLRATAARARGALGVVTIVGPERAARLRESGGAFDNPEWTHFPSIETGTGTVSIRALLQAATASPFLQVEVRPETGAAILGLEAEALDALFEDIRAGRRPAAREGGGAVLEIALAVETRRDRTYNVVAVLEGADPRLRNEYVVIGSHHDHVAPRDGRIFPGADDNISGVVGMFEIAEALLIERPKRSVIFVWHTAEEKGLVGAYHFVQHCPVPVEKISANLNLDMISRNPTDHLYLIASGKLSSELDASIRAANNGIGLRFDYVYDDPAHPDHFFFRSDQYPYIRYGIPGVWFFCGTTADYHQEGDVAAKADYVKMEKVSRLIYMTAMDIGNRPGLLALDAHPEIKTRGRHNMAVDWQKALRQGAEARRSDPRKRP